MKNNELLNFKNNEINSSLILSSPHSGSFYPEDFLSLSNIQLPDLIQNEDSFVDHLIDGTLDGGGKLHGLPFSMTQESHQAFFITNAAAETIDLNKKNINE